MTPLPVPTITVLLFLPSSPIIYLALLLILTHSSTREKKAGATIRIPITLDALGVIPTSAPATQLMEILKGEQQKRVWMIITRMMREDDEECDDVEAVYDEILQGAVGRQVGDIAAAVLSELKMKESVSAPQVANGKLVVNCSV